MYYEVVNDLVERGSVCNSEDLHKTIAQAQKNNTELYFSMFAYDEDVKTYTGSLKSYTGNRILERIVLDIDSVDMIQIRKLIDKLQSLEIPIRYIHPYFSGRGFHIELPNIFGLEKHPQLPNTLKLTMAELFPEIDQIYDKSRVIRAPLTINKKVNLYKTPITLDEIYTLSLNEIKELAKVLRTDFAPFDAEIDPILHDNVIQKSVTIKKPIKSIIPIVVCTQRMFNEIPESGIRHQNAMRIASSWRRAGVPYDATWAAIDSWLGKVDAATRKDVQHAVYDVYFSTDGGLVFGCTDFIMSRYCDQSCVYFKNKDLIIPTLSAEEAELKFSTFMNTDFSNRRFNLSMLSPSLNEWWTYPGELLLLQGDTGLSKTAIAQIICLGLSTFPILYLSLEVHSNLLYRRFIQIAHNMTKEEVYAYYKSKVAKEKLSQLLNHIRIISSNVTLESIPRLITQYNPQLIVIDTTDGLSTKERFSDSTPKGDYIAEFLRDIAQRTDIIILGIHHISKFAANNLYLTGLSVHSGKGSAAFEHKADKVLGIEGNKEFPLRKISVLKARDESVFELWGNVDANTFRFSEVEKPKQKPLRVFAKKGGEQIVDQTLLLPNI